MGRRRRDRYWGAAAIRARLFPWRRDSQARTPSSRPQRAPFCLAASVQARWVGRDWPLPRRPSRPQALSCHCRGYSPHVPWNHDSNRPRLCDEVRFRGTGCAPPCAPVYRSIARSWVAQQAFPAPSRRLQPRRFRPWPKRKRGGQTAVSLSRQGIEIDRANPRGKNATAFVTLLACRLLFALHRQPPFFSIEC
jgi:hypothetical protein